MTDKFRPGGFPNMDMHRERSHTDNTTIEDQRPCACGCGEYLFRGTSRLHNWEKRKYIDRTHQTRHERELRIKEVEKNPKYCECGCGEKLPYNPKVSMAVYRRQRWFSSACRKRVEREGEATIAAMEEKRTRKLQTFLSSPSWESAREKIFDHETKHYAGVI